MQREEQQRLADELFSPISGQIQPESIEARIELYKKRIEYEERGIEYKIVKERFLNWRVNFAQLRVKNETVLAHFLPYSTIRGGYSRGRIEYSIDELYYMNRDEVKFISLDRYNKILETKYENIEQLLFNPPRFELELKVRKKIISNIYSLSTVIVVEHIPTKKVEITLKSYIYEDVKEVIYEI